MNADQLRALQAPHKDRYREDPSAAFQTLRAVGTLVPEQIQCRVGTGVTAVDTGLHPSTGGDGNAACSANMLLEALIGCAGVTLSAVATAMGIGLRGGHITAEGTIDFRGTLGVDKTVPIGLTNITLNFQLDTDASAEQVATLIKLTERYCVVYQTLKNPPEFHVKVSTS